MVRVLITDSVSNRLIDILRSAGIGVDYYPDIDPTELRRIVGSYEALTVRSRTRVTKDIIEAGKNLRVIARVGVGLDNIDVEYATKKGITVINAGEATAESVAELTMGLILAIIRKIHHGYVKLREKSWAKNECFGMELHGKTLGIIGAGNIGTALGKIAYYGFGMRVLGYRRRLELVQPPLIPTPLDELLSNSDIISIHLPLNNETERFFGRELFSKLRRGAYVINTSRMGVIDLDALIEALESKLIGGFAADTDLKPTDDPRISKLLSFENVLLTPHIGAQTGEAQDRAAEYIARKLIELLGRTQ
ncbi:MAG: 3-phosphoglycerate dehydrogenase [Crenarchaeota archaeon]|nr:3-phosphoglycerate dehydrogenase [Thermoproteota archaeon]MCR8470255.1 3-phosphoglycerate dehydrogenase [Thermoproteota archaeon]MCR8472180.1 3-phosphoglycerate dehydrogenase [Thermoproteota archaeon]